MKTSQTPVVASANRETPHVEVSTCVDAHPRIAAPPDRGRGVHGRGDLVKLATRPILEEALEAESRDALGREYYAHGAEPGRG